METSIKAIGGNGGPSPHKHQILRGHCWNESFVLGGRKQRSFQNKQTPTDGAGGRGTPFRGRGGLNNETPPDGAGGRGTPFRGRGGLGWRRLETAQPAATRDGGGAAMGVSKARDDGAGMRGMAAIRENVKPPFPASQRRRLGTATPMAAPPTWVAVTPPLRRFQPPPTYQPVRAECLLPTFRTLNFG